MSDSATQRERRFARLSTGALVVFVLTAAYSSYSALRRSDYYAATQAGMALLMFSFPFLIARFLRFPIPWDCRLLYFTFVFCTVIVGSSFYGYSRIPYWDKFFHFFSGLLISAAGLMLCHLFFRRLDGPRLPRRALYALFPFLFNLAVAALWEIYEYLLFILFDVDAVNHLTTGVHDTLQDVIVCFVGGILFLVSMLRCYLTGKRGFLLNVCAHFFAVRSEEFNLP